MIEEQLGSIPLTEESHNPKELFDIDDIEGKTELSGEQVMIVSRLKVMGDRLVEKYGIDSINKFIKNFLELQVSKDRQSRKEFVSAMQSEQSMQNQSLLDRISLGGQPK